MTYRGMWLTIAYRLQLSVS